VPRETCFATLNALVALLTRGKVSFTVRAATLSAGDASLSMDGVVLDATTFLNRLVSDAVMHEGERLRVWGCEYGGGLLGFVLIENIVREVRDVNRPQMQVKEKDAGWCEFVMEHLPDSADEDDLTYFNNRQDMP